MRRMMVLAALALATVATACSRPPAAPAASATAKTLPAWAYPQSDKTVFGPPPAGPGPFHMAGSPWTFSKAQVADDENPVDWFPTAHPPPPAIVAHNPGNGPIPCAECHFYNGAGALGTPDLAGLPADYIVRQVKAFRSGERRSAQADRGAVGEMIQVANKVTDADLAKAAAYFAALPRPVHVTVVETDTVPATWPDKYGWLNLDPTRPREPIAGRIVEVSKDFANSLLGDDRIGHIDYVPVGAVKRGEAVVASGGPGGLPCRGCHGADLRGQSPAPPLAGRPATYLARALWDLKRGARTGAPTIPMQVPARGLTADQIRDVVAYLASQKP